MPDVRNPDPTKDGEGGRQRDADGQRLVPANEVSDIVSRRVKEAKAEAERRAADLQRQLDDLRREKDAPPPPKVYTRAQLAEAVDKGVMTQTQANAVWDRQQQDLTRRTAAEAATAAVQEEARARELGERIAKYTAHDPALKEEGSDARNRIAAEVRRQVEEFGLKGLAAEYAALRVVYGDHDKLHNGRERGRQAHMDSMGAGGATDGDRSEPTDVKVDSAGNIKGLTAPERAHYQKLIDRGMYKGWDEVAEEMKFANKGLRQRVAARR